MRILSDPRLVIAPFKGADLAWDEFVSKQESASFAHLSAWREVMTDVLGHECMYRVALSDDGELQGVLPLVRVKSRIFGHYLVSMPFLSYGGPIGSRAAQKKLAADAERLAQASGADLLELRTREPIPSNLLISERKIIVVLDLPDSAESLWNEGFKAKLRSQVKRPLKEGMQVKFGAEQVEPFYEVFARNMRDLGTPVMGRGFFERIAARLGDCVVFCAVYWRGEPIAAGCGFIWRDEFEITWASSIHEYNRYAPNMLLYWSLMERMIDQGLRVFNFGRCSAGGGTHRFKTQWGGKDIPLRWAQWSPNGTTAPPAQDNLRFRLASFIWRRTPLRITNQVGPALARCLP